MFLISFYVISPVYGLVFSFALITYLGETDMGFPVFDYDIMLLLVLDGFLLIPVLFIVLTVDGIKSFIIRNKIFFSTFLTCFYI